MRGIMLAGAAISPEPAIANPVELPARPHRMAGEFWVGDIRRFCDTFG